MITKSFEETFELGKKFGQNAKNGEIYALVGEMGAGKTVFSKGFASGLGITVPITSPTFSIVHEYPLDNASFYHFDVYRIMDINEMEDTGFYEYVTEDSIMLLEWADKIKEIMPPHTQWIEIKIIDATKREIIRRD